METAAPCPSRSPHRSLRSRFLYRPLARRLARSYSRNSILVAPVRQSSLHDDGRLSLSRALASSVLPSFAAEGTPPRSTGRGKSKERKHTEETARGRMRDTWSFATSRRGDPRCHPRNSSITYQPRVTRDLVMHSCAMLICSVREVLAVPPLRKLGRCQPDKRSVPRDDGAKGPA